MFEIITDWLFYLLDILYWPLYTMGNKFGKGLSIIYLLPLAMIIFFTFMIAIAFRGWRRIACIALGVYCLGGIIYLFVI